LPRSGDGGLEGDVETDRFSGHQRTVCAETIRIRLHGTSAEHPASVVEPLLISDLPVFLRWRGLPDFDSSSFQELIGVVDRLIVDSTEWPDPPAAYGHLAEIFDRVVVSDIAWARTSRWRPMLASLWPEIADVRTIKVRGTAAQAHLLAGWLRSRLDRPVELEHDPADRLEGVDIDGKPAPFPPGDPPIPADLLSDELDRMTRDRVYESAVAAAAGVRA
jgi:glucose-6-phosphate dehydrogenase assembly protein OpcA